MHPALWSSQPNGKRQGQLQVKERNILLELCVQSTGGLKEEGEGGAVIRKGRVDHFLP